MKERHNRGELVNLYFWRDRTGNEVDVIAEWGYTLRAIEIKAAMTWRPDFLKGAQYFRKISLQPTKTYVLYAGQPCVVQDTRFLSIVDAATLCDEDE